uniref:Uncharacterized protein n=1 Tax=Arundo donax TaxID=35708 RepID=A0A0A9EHZ8_ARUDO
MAGRIGPSSSPRRSSPCRSRASSQRKLRRSPRPSDQAELLFDVALFN